MSDNPLMSTATAILVCMLDGRPDDAKVLVGRVDPDERLLLIEAFAKSWCWTTVGMLRGSGHGEAEARATALRMARGLTLDLAALDVGHGDGSMR